MSLVEIVDFRQDGTSRFFFVCVCVVGATYSVAPDDEAKRRKVFTSRYRRLDSKRGEFTDR